MQSIPATPKPVTMMVTRHISPERYNDFREWMRQGEILAAGFPGFLGSGVLQPPEGGDQFQIVMRFDAPESLHRFEHSVPRRMWLERGTGLVLNSRIDRASGMDTWFGSPRLAPPRWKQAISIWIAYFPMLLLFSLIFKDQLAALPVFWRVFITTATMTPILSFVCIPVITRLLRGWLQPAQPPAVARVLRWRLMRR